MPEWNPRANDIFVRAVEIDAPADRRLFLEQQCGGDAALQAQVESLLAAGGKIGSFLEKPAVPAPPPGGETTAYRPLTEGPGTVIGPYKLLQHIGEGGFGAVYMAEQEHPVRRKVALKIIKLGMDTREVIARFESERQALAMMEHPNIARVFDAGATESGRPYFVMELVRGVPITEFCDKNRFSAEQRLKLFINVCNAIQHAHHKGIIHRDIKPSNVMVTLHDGVPVVKVIDFGVAKATAQKLTERTLFTAYGQMIGTPAYMSPEQAEMSGLDIDMRSDIFSLGVLLYELLTGTTPLDSGLLRKAGYAEMQRMIREEEAPRPSTRFSSMGGEATVLATNRGTDAKRLSQLLRSDLDWIVMKSLEKDRNRRYGSPATFADDVERYLTEQAVEARPPSTWYRFRKMTRRNKAALTTAAVVAAALVVGTAVSAWQAVAASRAEVAALAERDEKEKALQAEAEQRATAVKSNAELARTTELQRKTRYSAEINLVQAAHNAKDMEQVKKLLLAQAPKVGEPDDRGPEWHYWDRKLNGFEKEFTLPIAEPKAPGSGRHSIATLSEDGSRVAEVQILTAFKHDSDKLIIRVWDTDSGRLLKTLDRDANEVFKLAGGNPEQSSFRTNIITFKNGHRDLLLHYSSPTSSGGNLPPGFIRDLSWNTETDAVRLLDRAELEPRQVAGDITTRHSTYTEDLTFRATVSGKSRAKESGLTIVRMADEKVVFERPVPNRAMVHWLPDGQRFLLSSIAAPARKEPGESSLRTRAVELWQVGGEKPIWTREDVLPSESTPVARTTSSGPRFTSDRKYYSDYERLRTGGVTANHYDLATGKLLDSRPLLESGFQKRANPFQFIAGGRTDLAFDRDSQGVAAVFDSGVAIRRWSPDTKRRFTSAYEPAEIEMLDGAPHTFALRSDGTLVTLHRFAQDAKLRHWRLAADQELDREPLSGVFSPDGTRYATIITKLETVAFTQGTARTAAKPVRLVVVDAAGKKLLNVASTEAEAILGAGDSRPGGRTISPGYAGFLGNGRYFYYSVRKQDKKDDTTTIRSQLVVRDMDAGKDVLRVEAEQYRGVHFNREATRYIIVSRLGRTNPNGVEAEKRPNTPATARLYEFPSGRLICELKPPAEKTVRSFSYDGENWFGTTGPTTPERTAPEVYFDWETGKYLGERNRSTTRSQSKPNERLLRQEQAAGSRVVKTYYAGGRGGLNSLEIWDAAKSGPDDAPLFKIEDTTAMNGYLSPDGKRLLLVLPGGQFLNQPESQVTLYCTDTGRPIVTLPTINRRSGFLPSPSGFWSTDGQQFFNAMTPDGTLTGYDFRPRKPSK